LSYERAAMPGRVDAATLAAEVAGLHAQIDKLVAGATL
jgi:hypothetical protein